MLLRHALLYLPAQVLGPAIQLISVLLWAYALAPDEVGLVTLVVAMQEMGFALFFMWWSHYALRFLPSFSGERRRRFIACETAALLICGAGQTALAVAVLRLYFPAEMSPSALAVAALFMLTRSLSAYMSERARAEAQIGLYTLLQIAGPLLGLAIGFLLLFKVSHSPTSILGGLALSQALTVAVAAVWSDFGRAGSRPDREILPAATKFGAPVAAAQLLAAAAVNAPRFLVEHFSGLAAAGSFAVGYGLGLRVSSFAVMLVTAGAYPLVVRKMETEGVAAAYAQLAKNIVLVALTLVPVGFGLLAVNDPLVDLLIPPDYRATTSMVLPLATLGGLMRYLRAHTIDQAFLIRARTILATAIAAIDFLFGLASALLGLQLLGIAGAAAGLLASGAATLAASWLIARFTLGFRLPARDLAKVVLAAGAMAVIVRLAPLEDCLFGLSLRIGLGIAIYGGLIVVLLPEARRTAATLYAGVERCFGRRLLPRQVVGE